MKEDAKHALGLKLYLCYEECYMAVLCKTVPSCLGRCHTKRSMGMSGHAHSSFGMTPTFKTFFRPFRVMQSILLLMEYGVSFQASLFQSGELSKSKAFAFVV